MLPINSRNLSNMQHIYTLSNYHNIPGTLELFCSEETVQNVLMSGAKINVSDINIKEDKIIMEDLN